MELQRIVLNPNFFIDSPDGVLPYATFELNDSSGHRHHRKRSGPMATPVKPDPFYISRVRSLPITVLPLRIRSQNPNPTGDASLQRKAHSSPPPPVVGK